MSNSTSPFEQIRRVNPAGNEFWSSRDFARVLAYTDYRNFEAVIEKARTACFNSGQRGEGHFVEITEMIEIGNGTDRIPTGFRPPTQDWQARATMGYPATPPTIPIGFQPVRVPDYLAFGFGHATQFPTRTAGTRGVVN